MCEIKFPKNNSAFTFIEIISVIIIIGIISAVLIGSSNNNSDAIVDGDSLKSYLRQTQMRALADNKTWSLTVNGNSTLKIERNSSKPDTIYSRTYELQNNSISSGTITFNNRGVPSGNLTFTITDYPEGKVTVTPSTGFVP